MAKINNIVRLVHFTSENDLYYQIDKEMNTDGEDGGDTRCYRIKDINLIDEENALVYFEEDLSVVKVHFFDVMGKEVKFEEKLKKLENIVNELESGEIDLDESIEKYKEAMNLVKECDSKLKSVEEQVNKIVTENGTLEDFNIE